MKDDDALCQDAGDGDVKLLAREAQRTQAGREVAAVLPGSVCSRVAQAGQRSPGRAQKFGARRAGAAARRRPAIAKKAAESPSLRTFGAAAPATRPKLEAASRRKAPWSPPQRRRLRARERRRQPGPQREPRRLPRARRVPRRFRSPARRPIGAAGPAFAACAAKLEVASPELAALPLRSSPSLGVCLSSLQRSFFRTRRATLRLTAAAPAELAARKQPSGSGRSGTQWPARRRRAAPLRLRRPPPSSRGNRQGGRLRASR